MREYKYRAILKAEDGSNFEFVYDVRGRNKEDAIANIDVCFPCSVKSIHRVNASENRRPRKTAPTLACVDMGQCSK